MTDKYVLIVEDDPDIRDMIVEVLREGGHCAIGATNGREALAQLRRNTLRPCLILLDMRMPVMDGRKFRTEQLNDPDLASIPVVALSATAEADSLDGVALVRKPVRMQTLLELVEKYDG